MNKSGNRRKSESVFYCFLVALQLINTIEDIFKTDSGVNLFYYQFIWLNRAEFSNPLIKYLKYQLCG